jgi:hypothetical protein
MTRQTVVIEYEWKGYTEPDWRDALQVTAQVTHADGATQPQGQNLSEIRDSLEDMGFTQGEVIQPVKTHNGGRWCPTWREVWAREVEICAPVYGLSPEAEKAQREAAGGMRGWWPWLKRTSTKAILKRPRNGGYRHRKAFAQWVEKSLPGFRFNSKRNWWEADLDYLPEAYGILLPDGVNVSDGVQDYLEVTR